MTTSSRPYTWFAVGCVAVFTAVAFAMSVAPGARDAHAQTSTKKAAKKGQPAKQAETVTLTDETDDPAVWGKLFPLHYELYAKTVDMQRTKYGGSEAVPHAPTDADPRSMVARTKVERTSGCAPCGRAIRLPWIFVRSAVTRTC